MSERHGRRAAEGQPISARLRQLIFMLWAMLLLICVTAVWSIQLLSAEVGRLTQVQAPALEANDQILLAMTDAQTGLNGYEISGDRAMLQPYFGAHQRTITGLATVKEKFEVLMHDEIDDAKETELVASLEVRQRVAVVHWWALAIDTEKALSRGESAETFQGRAMFDRFRGANAAIAAYLGSGRDQSLETTRTISTSGTVASIAATLAALVAAFVLGSRAARFISQPMTELRDTLIRQREGESSARAREDQGSPEIRSLATDINALTEQSLGAQQSQALALRMDELTLEIERAMSTAPDTQQALDTLCAALGQGLGTDRVMASTVGADREALLGAQWHLPDLAPLGALPDDLVSYVGELAEELWSSSQQLVLNDLFELPVRSWERAPIFHCETGARAVILVPIGLGARVVGVVSVITVREPREWTDSEAKAVQKVAAFAARVIAEAEYRARQNEYVERLERLELLDHQKTDFLATVSHELRTPLTSISGYLELLQDEDAGELTEEQHRMLEVMNRNTSRLRGLIEDLLALNQIEAGELLVNADLVSMRELVTAAGQDLLPLAQSSAIELQIDAGGQAAIVQGESGQLHSAVVNVVSNAIKFSHPGGVVTMRCSLDLVARRVLVTCHDRGIGIPAEDQGQLFTRFHRASNVMDRAMPGAGLGLVIVKQIVEGHGGAVRLTSVEGEGTTVVIDLPLSSPVAIMDGGGNGSQPGDVSAYVPDLAD